LISAQEVGQRKVTNKPCITALMWALESIGLLLAFAEFHDHKSMRMNFISKSVVLPHRKPPKYPKHPDWLQRVHRR